MGMQQYSLTENGYRVEVLADADTAKLLSARYELAESSETERVDYVIGLPEGTPRAEGSKARPQGRLSYGTCRILRSSDAEFLVAAFERHLRTMTAERGNTLDFLGCALTRDNLLVAAPIELLSTSEGWLRRIVDAGWRFHPGSRVSIRSKRATLTTGTSLSHDWLSGGGGYNLGGLILEARFATGTTQVDEIGHVLRSCDRQPNMSPGELVEEATAIVQSDIDRLNWDGSLPSVLPWLEGLPRDT